MQPASAMKIVASHCKSYNSSFDHTESGCYNAVARMSFMFKAIWPRNFPLKTGLQRCLNVSALQCCHSRPPWNPLVHGLQATADNMLSPKRANVSHFARAGWSWWSWCCCWTKFRKQLELLADGNSSSYHAIPFWQTYDLSNLGFTYKQVLSESNAWFVSHVWHLFGIATCHVLTCFDMFWHVLSFVIVFFSVECIRFFCHFSFSWNPGIGGRAWRNSRTFANPKEGDTNPYNKKIMKVELEGRSHLSD